MLRSILMTTGSTKRREWLTPSQAAARLGVHVRTLTRHADEGTVPVHRLSETSHRRYLAAEIDALLGDIEPDEPP